jgi:Na+-translocating ferredoxin:NAD+ oxidoreductase RnfG subunit
MLKTLAALALIGAACGFLLFALNDITRGDIEKNRTKKAREIMTELLKQPLPDEILWVDDISGDS